MLLTVLGVLAGSCAKEQPEPGIEGIELQVVGTTLETPDGEPAPATRATEINKIFTFEDGDALSLFMRGATYADVDNRRVAYSKLDPADGIWTIEGSPILLNDRTAVVSLVYPYKDGATFDNIPFTTGVYSPDKDLLWKQQSVYDAVHEARVEQMQHALTRVKFIIKRDDPTDTSIPDRFTGTGSVSSVDLMSNTVRNHPLFTEGKLDLSFTAPDLPVTGVNSVKTLTYDTAFTLSTTGHTIDLLQVPVSEGGVSKLHLRLVVDNELLSVALLTQYGLTPWEAGSCYTYNVTVKNRRIQIDFATVDDWETGTSGGSDVEKPEPASVGAYYYSDGTTSYNLNSTKTATGMVFWVDPTNPARYKVMALQEKFLRWESGFYGAITEAQNFEDGRANSEAIKAYFEANKGGSIKKTEFSAAFPAAEYCYNYNAGVDAPGTWYLPALHEMQYLVCAFNGSAPVTWETEDSPLPIDTVACDAWNARICAVIGASGLRTDVMDSDYYSSTENVAHASYVWSIFLSPHRKFWKHSDLKFYSSGKYTRCIREIN